MLKNAIINICGQECLEKLIEKKNNEGLEKGKSLSKDEFIDLINDLSNVNPDIRIEAVRALGKTIHEKSAKYLINALTDEDINVKIEILKSLGKLNDPIALDSIIKISIDENLPIRITAEEVIIDFGSVAIDALYEALKDDNEEIRYVCVVCLNEIEDDRVIDILIENINDPDSDIKLEIIKGLKKSDNKKAMTPLLELINDDNIEVSKRAIQALENIGDESVLKTLIECIDELNYPLKKKIVKAIKRIEKRINSQLLNTKEEIDIVESNSEVDKMTGIENDYDKIVYSKEDEDPFDILDQIEKK